MTDFTDGFVPIRIWAGGSLTLYWNPEPKETGTGEIAGINDRITLMLDLTYRPKRIVGVEIKEVQGIVDESVRGQAAAEALGAPGDFDLTLGKLLAEIEKGTFKPYVWYCESGDRIEAYWKGVSYAGRYVSDDFGIYVSEEDDNEVIGCWVGGIKALLEKTKK